MPKHRWGQDYVSDIAELRERDICRTLTKDARIPCMVKSCHKKPKKDEQCYYPSPTTSNENKYIGHKLCVDRAIAEITSKGVAAHTLVESPHIDLTRRKIQKPKYQSTIDASKDFPPVSLDEVKADMQNVIAAFREKKQDRQSEDYQRGYRDAWAEIKSQLGLDR